MQAKEQMKEENVLGEKNRTIVKNMFYMHEETT